MNWFLSINQIVSINELEVFEQENENMIIGSNKEFSLQAYDIKQEVIDEVLQKLRKLEEEKLYLNQDFTLQNVAKQLNTNIAYLTKIMNNELGKNFSNYVNELRINYVILELKNNPNLRKYSTEGIANEIGYKNLKSFTKYFKMATGITPYSYIKNLNDN